MVNFQINKLKEQIQKFNIDLVNILYKVINFFQGHVIVGEADHFVCKYSQITYRNIFRHIDI